MGDDRLGGRISAVSLYDEHGQEVTYKKFVPGEYVADRDFSSWKYEIDLTPPKNQGSQAHVSWVGTSNGVLHLDDLLPQFASHEAVSAEVSVELPEKWRAFSNNRRTTPDNVFACSDITKAIIFIGKDLLQTPLAVQGGFFHLVVDGSWNFTYFEFTSLVREIDGQYGKWFGNYPDREFSIAILKFTVKVPVDQWEADTRGTSVLILSSDTPFKSQSVQRLHEQLRHEIFHLWIPEGVNLTGSYDWFYEGFALYQSLKLGLAVNRIRFDDYLDTLSRAYDIDIRASPKISLIQASKDRWNGANTQVYARGMLVAFLCDLALLDGSKGKTSVTDLLHDLYVAHRPPAAAADGNETVLALLRSHTELVPIVDRYITGAEPVEWQPLLTGAGLGANAENKLTVLPKLTGRQRDLLDKLGYNNWRKLPPTPRK